MSAAAGAASASRKVLHVAGYKSCGFFVRALNVLRSAAVLFPGRLKVVPHEFDDRTSYRAWLVDSPNAFRESACFPEGSRARNHSSSPFVWFGKSSEESEANPDDVESFLGGHDDSLNWCRSFLTPKDDENDDQKHAAEARMVDDGHTSEHKYDYDLVVIGGGSGGMAAAKEAAALGAKVACLDFVKPSPHGTTWGLGGTCVNVGCIPKKLFHAGALLRQSVASDSAAFGLRVATPRAGEDAERKALRGSAAGGDHADEAATIDDPDTEVSWEALRENIQNWIRGLNFKYRVRLREKDVTYMNKLATFVDDHTIEAVDKKGRSSTITSSRFLVAVGGRPQQLTCPGSELAISSDDVFSLEKNPGKTLCVGASYISLECAGFLAAIGCDVTVAVRSILLRGFDRECSDRIDAYMQDHGVKFRREVVPSKLEKVDGDNGGGKIRVTFSDGTDDVYDTVLVAIGREADTSKLGVDKVGLETNPKNGKIVGKYEQSSCPNIYAVGDVLDKTPELTPVAIQAGIHLARRLFGGSKEPMDYVNVCTTVFTPIEYACVGLSEDDAIERYGADNIDVYHREFVPLEWSMSEKRSHGGACFTKVVVDRTRNEKVLGMHFVGPNAGEVMQGFGVAMKQGLDFKTLTETVGIHPTSAEEMVTVSVTKRSGEDAAAGGC